MGLNTVLSLTLISVVWSSTIAQQPYAHGVSIARPDLPVSGNSRAYGYQTYGNQGGAVAVAGGTQAAGGGASGYDFNPALLGGQRGAAGIKARINQRGFQYASTLLAPILDQQIRSARIPPISQCIPEVNGCIQVYNLYVSRYRCPQRVVLYPAPPNQIVLAVQNLDIGVTGNLGGQIVILIPIALTGIIQVNAHQVSLTVSLVVDRAPTGGVALRMASCSATIGYLDAYIENGGLIGDIANSQFRGRISSQIKQMLPGQLCAQLPNIINQQLNSKLGAIPQTIALTQILSVASSAFGLSNLVNGGGAQCPASCAQSAPAAAPAPQAAPPVAVPPVAVPPVAPAPAPVAAAPVATPAAAQSYREQPPQQVPTRTVSVPSASVQQSGPPPNVPDLADPKYSTDSRKVSRVLSSGITRTQSHALPVGNAQQQPLIVSHTSRQRSRRQAPTGANATQLVLARPRALGAASTGQVAFPSGPNPCSGCPGAGQADSPTSVLLTLAKSLDLNKLNNIYLTIQLLQSYATTNDYTIELNGEFSPNGQGGTPFGPFPMYFPYPVGGKMAEALISDYTINSLFYWLHRTGFLTFRIGPETPKIGDLLKTTCSDDEEEGSLDDHGVELDEENENLEKTENTKRLRRFSGDTRRRGIVAAATPLRRRNKRQDDGGDDAGSLSDLGICFGDILPAIREKYPNQKIVIVVRTAQAPSLQLSSARGGSAQIDLVADADIYIESTNQLVGTISLSTKIDLTVSTANNRISGHAEITSLQLRDKTGSLGLPQDALDNLGNLGKEVIQKAGNDALEKGIALSVPSGIGGLPLNFVDPDVRIVDHALYVASDFTVDPSGLQSLLGGSGGGLGGSCPARKRKRLR